MNKFDKFYSKKKLDELIQDILQHRIEGDRISKEWYDALLIHLQTRELTDLQRKKLDYILKTEPDILKENLSQQVGETTSVKAPNNTISKNSEPKNTAIDTLKSVAFVALILGIFGAIIIWVTIGTIELPKEGYIYLKEKAANPQGIILGFEVLFSSIMAWAFFNVICNIAESLLAIRKSLDNN